MFIALPWVMDQLNAIGVAHLGGLIIAGFGLMAWMIFRVEQATDRGFARLDATIREAGKGEMSQ